MGCSDFQESISAYVDNELEERETRRLLLHLEDCEHCKSELSDLTLQKQRISLLLTYCYDAPNPGRDFAKGVISLLDKEGNPPSMTRSMWLFVSHAMEDLFYSLKRPAAAVLVAVLLAIGAVGGVLLKHSTSNVQLLSVYELASKQTTDDSLEVTQTDEDAESRLFDHFARSSVETFALRPCLLEYAAYSCSATPNE